MSGYGVAVRLRRRVGLLLLRIAASCDRKIVRFVMDVSGVSIALLTKWVDELTDTVYAMRGDQFIYEQVFDMIEKNPNLKANPSHFYLWMNNNYVERMAMGVRRLRDPRRKTISLKTLLRRIEANPSIVSRKHYFSMMKPSMKGPPSMPKDAWEQLSTGMMNGWYDKLVDEGAKAPSLHQLECEIAWLDTLGEPVVEYANKLIAHHDEEPPGVFPSMNDIDAFLDYAEGLLKKYIVLIKCIDQEFHVIFNYYWIRPFEFRWLPVDQPLETP
jgi:hypothetical protein